MKPRRPSHKAATPIDDDAKLWAAFEKATTVAEELQELLRTFRARRATRPNPVAPKRAA